MRMKKIVVSIFLLTCWLMSFSQTFTPPRSSPVITVQDSRYRALLNFYQTHTHGITMNGGLDSLGMTFYEDSSGHIWYRDTVLSGGHKWSMVLKTGDAGQGTVTRILTGYGFLPLTITDTGTLVLDTTTLNNLWVKRRDSTTIFVTPTQMNSQGFLKSIAGISAGGDLAGTYTSPTIQLNAVTFAKIQQLPAFSFIANPQASPANSQASYFGYGLLWNNDTVKVDTTKLKTVFGSASGSFITGAGNLSPLFTTGVTSNQITFTLSTAAAGSVFGNLTGSTAVPSFGVPTAPTVNGWLGYTAQQALVSRGIGYRVLDASGFGIKSFTCSGCTLDTTTSGQIGITVVGGGGASLSNNGSGFRLVEPLSGSNYPINTLKCSGCTLDSTTNAGSITINVSGSSFPGLVNKASGYRLAIGGTDTVKTVYGGIDILIDSTTNAGGITFNADTLAGNQNLATQGFVLRNSGGGSGTVTTVSVLSGNGFAGTVANASTTPAITLSTSVTGLIFGNGTAISNATVNSPLTYATGALGIQAGGTSQNGYISSTDWNTFNGKQGAITLTTTGTSGAATLIGNTLNIPQYAGTSYTFTNSLVNTSGTVTLVNDVSSPGNNYVYGTNGSGTRNWILPTSTLLNTWFGSTIQGSITLTTTGSSGSATLIGNTLNIPVYTGGSGGGSPAGTTGQFQINKLGSFAVPLNMSVDTLTNIFTPDLTNAFDTIKLARNWVFTFTGTSIDHGDVTKVGSPGTDSSIALRYSKIVCAELGATENNISVPGSILINMPVYQVPAADTNHPYVFMQYGINESTDTATFRSQIIVKIDSLEAQKGYTANQIVVLTGTPTGSTRPNVGTYSLVMKSQATAMGCRVIDDYNMIIKYYANTTIYQDSVHQLQGGHNAIARYIVGNIKDSTGFLTTNSLTAWNTLTTYGKNNFYDSVNIWSSISVSGNVSVSGNFLLPANFLSSMHVVGNSVFSDTMYGFYNNGGQYFGMGIGSGFTGKNWVDIGSNATGGNGVRLGQYTSGILTPYFKVTNTGDTAETSLVVQGTITGTTLAITGGATIGGSATFSQTEWMLYSSGGSMYGFGVGSYGASSNSVDIGSNNTSGNGVRLGQFNTSGVFTPLLKISNLWDSITPNTIIAGTLSSGSYTGSGFIEVAGNTTFLPQQVGLYKSGNIFAGDGIGTPGSPYPTNTHDVLGSTSNIGVSVALISSTDGTTRIPMMTWYTNEILAPTNMLPTGTTTDSVVVETTTSGVMQFKKVAQSSISGGFTFSNGLTNSSGSVTWGGAETANTTLTGTGFSTTIALGGSGTWKYTGMSEDTTGSLGLMGWMPDSSTRRFTWAALAAKISPNLPTFNIYFANGLTAAAGDSAYWGGTLNQNTSITQGAFSVTFGGTTGSQFNVTSDQIQFTQNTSSGFPILLNGLVASGSSSTITSGSSSAAATDASNIYINPASTLASYTLTLPSVNTEGSLCNIHFGGTLTTGTVVTSLTISAPAGTTILQTAAPTTAVAGACIIYRLHGTIWYREQ